jgi:guanylate kinase
MSGRLFVISAPSGVGKTTLLKKVIKAHSRLVFSVSHTTRSPRAGERHGVDYSFVSEEDFHSIAGDGGFIEHARVHGNLYGTSRTEIEAKLAENTDVILDIDVQGAKIIRDSGQLDPAYIFISPPGLAELERRLRGRGTESEEKIQLRLKNAAREMAAAPDYQYRVVNDSLEEASGVLGAIIIAERARGHRRPSGEPIIDGDGL